MKTLALAMAVALSAQVVAQDKIPVKPDDGVTCKGCNLLILDSGVKIACSTSKAEPAPLLVKLAPGMKIKWVTDGDQIWSVSFAHSPCANKQTLFDEGHPSCELSNVLKIYSYTIHLDKCPLPSHGIIKVISPASK